MHNAGNLGKWLNEPFVQNAVISVLMQRNPPMLLSEVAQACDLPIRAANRVLIRLHRKGFVDRYKLPMQRHAYCHRRKVCVAGGARRLLFVYSWANLEA